MVVSAHASPTLPDFRSPVRKRLETAPVLGLRLAPRNSRPWFRASPPTCRLQRIEEAGPRPRLRALPRLSPRPDRDNRRERRQMGSSHRAPCNTRCRMALSLSVALWVGSAFNRRSWASSGRYGLVDLTWSTPAPGPSSSGGHRYLNLCVEGGSHCDNCLQLGI
jgi:hypothetical protein